MDAHGKDELGKATTEDHRVHRGARKGRTRRRGFGSWPRPLVAGNCLHQHRGKQRGCQEHTCTSLTNRNSGTVNSRLTEEASDQEVTGDAPRSSPERDSDFDLRRGPQEQTTKMQEQQRNGARLLEAGCATSGARLTLGGVVAGGIHKGCSTRHSNHERSASRTKAGELSSMPPPRVGTN